MLAHMAQMLLCIFSISTISSISTTAISNDHPVGTEASVPCSCPLCICKVLSVHSLIAAKPLL